MIDWAKVKHVVCIRDTHELIKGRVYSVRQVELSIPKIILNIKTGKFLKTWGYCDKLKVFEITQRHTPLGVAVPPPYNDLGFSINYFKPLQALDANEYLTKDILMDA